MLARRVAVIDNQAIFRKGIAGVIGALDGVKIVGEGADAADALRIATHAHPDLLILDIDIPGGGLVLLRSLVTRVPAVLVLSFSTQPDVLCAALAMGVRGCVLKGASEAELIEAVRMIGLGKGYVSPTLGAALLARAGAARLTDVRRQLTCREEQILALVISGLRNKEIGGKLAITEKTVKHYMTQIYEKLNVRNRVEAAMLGKSKVRPVDDHLHGAA